MARGSGPHGIVLLDKGLGLSSNQALQQVKRLFRADRAGHTGSLDPLATGMLPVCLGEATKIAGHLLGARKAYRAELELGVITSTADREGAARKYHRHDRPWNCAVGWSRPHRPQHDCDNDHYDSIDQPDRFPLRIDVASQ